MTQLATRQSFESLRREDNHGEWWSARDLQFPLGYVEWRKFEDSIERAMAAASNAGHSVGDHFVGADKMVNLGSGAVRVVADYRLSRFGAYLVAMNGDPRKPEIACAQSYFAAQARKAEVIEARELTRLELIDMAREAEVGRLAEQERAELAEARVAEMAPLAAIGLDLASAEGDMSVRETAQALCRAGITTGERRLFAELRRIGWIQDSRRAYQRQIDIGRVRVKTDVFYDRLTGEPHMSTQVRITARGLADLHRILSGGLALVAGGS